MLSYSAVMQISLQSFMQAMPLTRGGGQRKDCEILDSVSTRIGKTGSSIMPYRACLLKTASYWDNGEISKSAFLFNQFLAKFSVGNLPSKTTSVWGKGGTRFFHELPFLGPKVGPSFPMSHDHPCTALSGHQYLKNYPISFL